VRKLFKEESDSIDEFKEQNSRMEIFILSNRTTTTTLPFFFFFKNFNGYRNRKKKIRN
jgi:hypothetical protein